MIVPTPGRKLYRRLRHRLRGPDRREPGLVNHVSLGSHCHMAQVLKTTGLRTWSSAFDWIFSSPGMVVDCLADDFELLLDPAQLESTPLASRPKPNEWCCRHRIYGERHAIPFVFNHHDPAANPADRRFLEDGVRRLRVALNDPRAENRFYVLTELATPDATVIALAEKLQEFESRNRLAFIRVVPGAAAWQVESRTEPQLGLTALTVSSRSRSVGLRFSDPNDEARLHALVGDLAAAPAA